MKVIKRNGIKTEVEFDEITRKIKSLAEKEPKLNIDSAKLAMEVIALIYDGISTSELDEFTASTSASMSLYNQDYEELAGRLIINNYHKNTNDSFCETMISLENIINDDIITLCENNKEIIDNIIDNTRDYNISYFGFNTLYKSYLLKLNKNPIERPQYMFLRVSLGIHINKNNLIEISTECLEKIKNTYNLLSEKYFTHATPTLFNAGTKYQQMSSCYLTGTEDSVEGIYKTISDVAMISKWAGGIGVHISNIRPSGSLISKTNGESQGIMPMLKVYNDTARYINQSSKRNGSFAMYLEPWHADIIIFLEAKKNNGAEEIRARDLFYALWIPDLFMKRVKNKEKWSLMCPVECPNLTEYYGDEFEELYENYELQGKFVKQIEALELWNAIINSQIESGTPYMLYKDSINHKSNQKNVGTIKSSNLCAEIVEYSNSNETAVCNLASICLPKYIKYNNYESIIVYSKDNCKYCDLTKKFLEDNDFKFEVIILNNDKERIEFYEKYTDDENEIIVNTMPQIFINNERIGGYTELLKFINNDKIFDYDKLGEVTETIVENLNIIIDKNYYPTKESQISNFKHRPIGIGVQGLADVFMKLKLPFTSEKAKKINKNIFEIIYYFSLKKSNELAKKHDYYQTFNGSPASIGYLQFDLWNKIPEFICLDAWKTLKQEIIESGLRNSLLVALMPTASTAQIMGNNESFEPYTSNMYTRRVLAGEFVLINKHLIEYLKEENLLSRDIIDQIILNKGSVQNISISEKAKNIFKTVWEISQKKLLEMSADRAPYICQSQSLNIFIEKADPKIINSVHMFGYSLGLKTGSYYIRTKPILSSQNFSIDYNKEKSYKKENDIKDLKEEYEPCLTCSS
jgi:ribonucleoside-diphosphate reductase alpha subunit